jgi:molybdate transport system permease protein
MDVDWFPLWLSLRVAFLSTAIAAVCGIAVAYLLANCKFRGREGLDALLTLPLVLPPTVLGYYLLVVLGRESAPGRVYESVFGGPLVFTWQAAVIAALLHSAPLLIKSARAALESVDHSYERAARTLGAGEWRIFWNITLPLARRSVLAGVALAFARSLGDFGVTIMVAGNIPGRTQTVAVAIYDAVEAGNGELARTLVMVGRLGGRAVHPVARQSHWAETGARMIQVRVRKHYAASIESSAFTLDVEFNTASGATVLFGPSGAGKTLTLDCIAGFVRPAEGRIVLDDAILFDHVTRVHLPPRDRRCGYVFQNYALFPNMTLRQNIEFAAERIPRLDLHRRFTEMI